MRNRKPTTKRLFLALVAALATAGVPSSRASEPNDSGAGKVCGRLKTFEGALQVFDSSRTHLGEASFGTKLRCGDWVAVESGRATIEHAGGGVFLAGENSFFQILDPQSGLNPEHAHLALYRGESVVQATGSAEIRVVTPNAVARVAQGGAFVVYSTAAEESQIVGLGGKATLENRFFSEKKSAAAFARFVAFANPVERIVPEEPRWVNAREMNERLAKVGVEASLREGIEKAVKAGSKTRLPVGLAPARPTIVVGDAAPFVPAQGAPLPESAVGHAPAAGIARAPASTPKSEISTPGPTRPKRVSAPKTARKPAANAEPDFALKRPESEARERARLVQALSQIRSDDEE